MITAVAVGRNGRRTLILGLSAENVRRLRANEPIHQESVPIEGLGYINVAIFGGRGTEDDLIAQLGEHFELPRKDQQ